jgi:DNA-binding MarR family transcriptional regulator
MAGGGDAHGATEDLTAPGGGPEEPAVRLQALLRLAALARPALADRLGISLNEVWAVEHLMAEPMGPVELSRRLDITSASATVLARRLEATGHVTREPHPDDRRRTVLRPTPGAVGSVMSQLGPFLEDIAAAGAGLDEAQRAIVTEYLRRVEAALERLLDRGRQPG